MDTDPEHQGPNVNEREARGWWGGLGAMCFPNLTFAKWQYRPNADMSSEIFKSLKSRSVLIFQLLNAAK